MAATCNIVPQVVNKEGKKVNSILFTDLLSLGLNRSQAIEAYKYVHSTMFKTSYGEWEFLPRTHRDLLDVHGEPKLDTLKPHLPHLFLSSSSKQSSSSGKLDNSLESIARKIKVLGESFEKVGITTHIKYDYTLNENAHVEGTGKRSAQITLNPDKVFDDTVPHEYGHIYVDILGYNHQLVQQGLNQLFDTDLYHEVKKQNPELSGIRFEKEVLATAIGREAATIFDNPEQIARWNFWLTRLFRAIGDFFGVEHNIARRLAMDMITGNVRKGKGSVSTYKQYQKATITTQEIEDDLSTIGLTLPEVNGIVDEEADHYVDNDKREYKRTTGFVDDNFAGKEYDRGPYEHAAYIVFKNKGVDINGTVEYEGEMYDYKGLTDKIRIDKDTNGKYFGKLGHAIIEHAVKPTADTQERITRYENGIPGKSKPIPPFWLSWLPDSIKDIMRELNINAMEDNVKPEDKDQLMSEVKVRSKIMGVAGTMDGLIRHSNGDFSIVDWKFGMGFFKDATDKFLKYGQSGTENIKDTPMNRAKLEVVLRAMMFKESYGKDIKFRWMKIAHLSKYGSDISAVDVRAYLHLIESYYMDTQNGKQAEYEQLKALGLFEPANYINATSNLENNDGSLPTKAERESDIRALEAIRYRLSGKRPTRDDLAEEERLVERITAANAHMGAIDNDADISDMSWWKRWVGNKYSSHHPAVQTFFRMVNKTLLVARNEYSEYNTEIGKLTQNLLNEYYGDNTSKGLVKTLSRNQLNGLNKQDLYSFMWVYKNEPDKMGWYTRVIEEKDGQYVDDKGNTYSKAKYEFNKYFRETMATKYNQVMSRPAGTKNGRTASLAEIMSSKEQSFKEELEPDFMPRQMGSFSELIERKGLLSKDALQYQADNFFFNYTESEYQSKDITKGIPLKYMGSKSIIAEENHSFDAELIFKAFMQNITMKDHMDGVYAYGSGIVDVLENQVELTTGESKYKSTVNFMRDQIYLNILNMRKDTKMSRLGWTFTSPKFLGGKTRTISPDRFARTVKSWVSNSTMWLHLIGATFNLALIIMLNAINGAKGSLAKRLPGFDDTDVPFTLGTLIKAQGTYANYIWDSITGNKENNKLFLLAQHMDFLPDNFDYIVKQSDLVGVKNKLLDAGNFYVFHSIGEEYGAMTLLAAQLHHYKMNGKSVLEQYDVQDGKLVYIGGKRGVHEDTGEEVNELTSDEITYMKRVYSRIHGGYRQEERTALELTAIGQFATQFRRFLPNALENLFQSKYNDVTIGKYETYEREDGETVYRWLGRVNEGRVTVLTKFAANMFRLRTDPNYNWDTMDNEQRKQLLDILVTGVAWAGLTTTSSLLFGDDDDDDWKRRHGKRMLNDQLNIAEVQWKKRLDRLAADSMQGMHVPDLLQSFQSQTIVFPKLYKTSVAVHDYLFNGIIDGRTTQRGDVKGESSVLSSLPVTSSYKQMRKFGILGDEDGVGQR